MKHLSHWLRAGVAAAACAALLAPSAFADNGKKPPGESPGNSANAPGQEKKHEPPADPGAPGPEIQPTPLAPPPSPPSEPAPAAAPDGPAARLGQPDKPQPAAPAASEQSASTGHAKPDKPKPDKPAESQRPAQAAAAAHPRSSGQGRSDEAHHHVIICHRTGSDSNPYVVINIPLTAWAGGHTTHPPRNGRSDILLRDPASGPGTKDGFTKEDCEARAGVTPPAATTTTSTTTSTATRSPTTAPVAGVAPGPSAAPEPEAKPTGGVVGPVSSAAGKRAGGGLDVSGLLGQTAVRGQLPFTGLPLWAVGLTAVGLIGLGLVLRRRSAHTTAL